MRPACSAASMRLRISLGCADRLLAHLGDHVALAHALGVGVGACVEVGDDEARHVPVEGEALAQVVVDDGHGHAEHGLLARRRRVGGRLGAGRRGQRRLLQQPDLDLERRLGAVAEHDDLDLLPPRRVGDDANQFAGVVDLLAAEAQHHVARLQARLERRALGNVGDERALGLGEADRLGHVVVDVLDAHAEPAAAGLAEVAELVDHPGRPPPPTWRSRCRWSRRWARGWRCSPRSPRPFMSKSGPPELPRLMAASVWMKSS